MKNIIQSLLILLKIVLILLIILVKLNIINDRPIRLIVELLFYLMISFYMIYLSNPFSKKQITLDHHDRILLFALSIIFLLTINYTEIFDEIKMLYFGENKKTEEENTIKSRKETVKYYVDSMNHNLNL